MTTLSPSFDEEAEDVTKRASCTACISPLCFFKEHPLCPFSLSYIILSTKLTLNAIETTRICLRENIVTNKLPKKHSWVAVLGDEVGLVPSTGSLLSECQQSTKGLNKLSTSTWIEIHETDVDRKAEIFSRCDFCKLVIGNRPNQKTVIREERKKKTRFRDFSVDSKLHPSHPQRLSALFKSAVYSNFQNTYVDLNFWHGLPCLHCNAYQLIQEDVTGPVCVFFLGQIVLEYGILDDINLYH